MTTDEAEAITGLLDAIGNYLGPQSNVRLACAAVCGCGLSPAAVAEFTRLLGGSTSWGAPVAAFTPACLSCGSTVDLDAVHRAATMGVAARVEHYCHDYAQCRKDRGAHAVAISGIAS